MKKDLFDHPVYTELHDRVQKLESTDKALWGKMNAGQMMSHCSVAIEAALGITSVEDKSNLLFRTVVKWAALSERPFSKGLPTGKEYIMDDRRDFDREKSRLLKNLKRAHEAGMDAEWYPHTVFGKLKPREWSWLLYKHTDHHLRQFGK